MESPVLVIYSPLRQKSHTLHASKVPFDQTNFPVLIGLTAATDGNWLKHAGQTGGHVEQTDGGDFVFTDNGNTVRYDHET